MGIEATGVEPGGETSVASPTQGIHSTRIMLLDMERLIGAVESRSRDVQDEGGRLNPHSGGRATGVALVVSRIHVDLGVEICRDIIKGEASRLDYQF